MLLAQDLNLTAIQEMGQLALFHTLYAVEAVVVLLCLYFIFVAVLVLTRTRAIHANLSILICTALIAVGVGALGRLAFIVALLEPAADKTALQTDDAIRASPFWTLCAGVRIFGIVQFPFCVTAMSIERLAATHFSLDYEFRARAYIFVTLGAGVLLAGGLHTYLIFHGYISEMLSCGVIIVVIVLFLTFRANRRKYARLSALKVNRSCYSLSERFQLVENLRTFRMMRIALTVILVIGIVLISAYLIVHLLYEDSVQARNLAYETIYILIFAAPVLMLLSALYGNPVWQRAALPWITPAMCGLQPDVFCCGHCRGSGRCCAAAVSTESACGNTSVVVRGLHGGNLNVPVEEEAVIYFRQLMLTWDAYALIQLQAASAAAVNAGAGAKKGNKPTAAAAAAATQNSP